jgi:hypothetical protein
MLAGSVALTLALKSRSAHLQQTDNKTTTHTTTDGKGSDNKDLGQIVPIPDVSGNHTVVFHKSLKLVAQEGLDIDDQKATILEQQSTASAPSDIYLSDYPSLFATSDKFYAYQASAQSTGNTDKDEYNSCQNIIAHSQLGARVITSGSKPGQRFCLTTTTGKLAIMTLQELVSSGSDSSQYNATISVKVWN